CRADEDPQPVTRTRTRARAAHERGARRPRSAACGAHPRRSRRVPDRRPRAVLVWSAPGAAGHVIDAEMVAAAMEARDGRPLVFVDLAVPRDIDPASGGIDGITLLDI